MFKITKKMIVKFLFDFVEFEFLFITAKKKV